MNHVHQSIAFRLLSKTISKSDDFQSRFRSNMTSTTCKAGLLTSVAPEIGCFREVSSPGVRVLQRGK
jgi:hypothetical protein